MFLCPVTSKMIFNYGHPLHTGYCYDDIEYEKERLWEDSGITIPNLLKEEDKLIILFDNKKNLEAKGADGEHWMSIESNEFSEALNLDMMSVSLSIPTDAQFGIEDWSIISSIHTQLDTIGCQHWEPSPTMVITEELPPALSYALVSWAKGKDYKVAIYQQHGNSGELQYI